MDIVLIIIFAVFGTAFGSFFNVCIDRLPVEKSILRPPSHCDACQHRLAPRDLVPLFSYLWLRRRCRYCGAPIPRRPFWVELGTGLLFALSYWYFGLSIQFAVIAFYGSLFLVIGVIDLEHQLILNKISYPAMALALVIAVFQPPPALIDLNLAWPWAGIVSSLMGGAIGLLFLLFAYVITLAIYKSEAIGFGDVKLAGLIGLATGPRLVLLSLTLGAILGGVAGIILLSLKMKKRKEPLSFGPFLAIATMITLIWGSDVLNWYLGLLHF
ncbi:MAG TPA: prepilin peptidase [Dehalococcoidia bacterium]|nr:prepilin peptidase [Dehalococcoidia bacterium]